MLIPLFYSSLDNYWSIEDYLEILTVLPSETCSSLCLNIGWHGIKLQCWLSCYVRRRLQQFGLNTSNLTILIDRSSPSPSPFELFVIITCGYTYNILVHFLFLFRLTITYKKMLPAGYNALFESRATCSNRRRTQHSPFMAKWRYIN